MMFYCAIGAQSAQLPSYSVARSWQAWECGLMWHINCNTTLNRIYNVPVYLCYARVKLHATPNGNPLLIGLEGVWYST